MLIALTRAVAQLSDPRLRRVLWRALGIAVAIFAGVWVAAWYGLDWAGQALAGRLAEGGFWHGVVDWLVGLGGAAAVLMASFLLFPAVMGLGQSFFLEDAADAVEARHYPDLPPAREQPILEALRDGIDLALVTLAVNLLALPVYIVLSLLPPLNVVVFYGVNGYLLGREYFEVVAVRRLPRRLVRETRRRFRLRIVAAGAVIAVLLTVPLVNLVAPVVAVAYMVHVFEGLRRRAGLPASPGSPERTA